MSYTLWSRGRVLGETDLGFIYRENGYRCGWFHPNALGERLMPMATGVAPALRAEWLLGADSTARANVLSAVDQEEALGLELRGADGDLVETEDIAIVDTHYLLVSQLDALIAARKFANRSQAIEVAVRETLARLARTRLIRETTKLDPRVEKALAEDGFNADAASWPES